MNDALNDLLDVRQCLLNRLNSFRHEFSLRAQRTNEVEEEITDDWRRMA